jgi:DNA polymerase-3 subunit epsilon
LIKRHRPLYNIQLRQTEVLYAWRLTERQGQCRITLGQSDDLFFDQDCHLYGLFTSPRQAQSTLRAVVDEHALCAVCLGLEKGRSGKPCFAYQVKRCLGACTGVESAQSHGARLKHALAPWQLSLWPYHGPIGIREGPMMHLIDRWQYLGSAQSEEEITALLEPQRTHFDRDVYRILKPRLSRLASRLVSFARYT